MKCPNCGFPMKYEYENYPYLVEYHYCPMCNIIYNKCSKTWIIPERYERVTEKQQNAISFINDILNKNFKPVLKSEATNIIKKYLKTAWEQYDEQKVSYYNELDEFYNEFCNG